ncbi:hybrid sensor histidine kinase/response regulator [Desulfobacterales bacterium HSG17]|nr:hybrid sensor histidine kinase/response regulator [Desulfobacterales bacterium HSG17]
MENEKEFKKRLLAAFAIEAQEHIKAVSQGLAGLEQKESFRSSEPGRSEAAIDIIFRAMHSLKGAARAVDMRDVETVCQAVENIFASWKRGKSEPEPEQFEILFQAVDALDERLSSGQVNESLFSDLIEKLNQLASDDYEEVVPHISTPQLIPEPEIQVQEVLEKPPEKKLDTEKEIPVPPKKIGTDTIRISAEKLDTLLLQTEEMISAKLAVGEFVTDISQIQGLFTQWQNEYAKIKTNNQAVRGQVWEFISWNEIFLNNLQQTIDNLKHSAEENHCSLAQMVDILLEDMKKTLMLPFSSLTEIFPKMIRSLSGEQGKDLNLNIEGDNIKIDRRVLEQIKDPLIHIIRNSIDHGIETPEQRIFQGKNPQANINIKVTQTEADKVEIEILDDGRGIDIEKIRTSAVKRGIISKSQTDTIDMKKACSMIFQSEFSTSPMITDISGRGIGLSIVQENLEKLGGSIQVDSEPGKGICFKMLIPVTLASFRGIFIKVSDRTFLVPTINVDRVLRVRPEQIKTIENRDTIIVNEKTIPIVRLDDLLELPRKHNHGKNRQFIQAIILRYGKKCIAFSVNQIINEQEGLVKSIGSQLARVKAISGATIYGKGKIAPILNVQDLMKCAKNIKTSLLKPDMDNESGQIRPDLILQEPVRSKSILVADDSVTSRMLLKNILESVGYNVSTAVDGMEAFILLKEKIYDLVVSDVEMPGMDGFGLTEKIRNDNTFANLPVILVTALESREDKERGIDTGANAYIVKSSFDRNNLLEVVQRLI